MGTKRILVYSHDTFGLGNIRRMLAICEHLTQRDPKLDILILSGSPLLNAFRIPPRIDYVKLPCLARNIDGHYDTKFLRMQYAELIRMRSNIILNTALDFAPDLVLVDKKPLGVESELEPCLRLLQRRLNPHFVLLLRDILDSPEATIPVWQRQQYHEVLEAYYSRVLVVGDPRVFDAVAQYEFPASSAALTRYCGYLARPADVHSAHDLREQLTGGAHPLVLVAAGGGGDGYQVIGNYLQGLRNRRTPAKFQSVVFCGPEMPIAQRDEARALGAGIPNLTIDDFTNDMQRYVHAADLIVSMGGYNTVCEFLTARTRALVIPRERPVQEQLVRAQALASLGLCHYIEAEALTPALMMARVTQLLAAPAPTVDAHALINMRGLDCVAAELHALLQPASQAASMATSAVAS